MSPLILEQDPATSDSCLVVLTDALYLPGTRRLIESWNLHHPPLPLIVLSPEAEGSAIPFCSPIVIVASPSIPRPTLTSSLTKSGAPNGTPRLSLNSRPSATSALSETSSSIAISFASSRPLLCSRPDQRRFGRSWIRASEKPAPTRAMRLRSIVGFSRLVVPS